MAVMEIKRDRDGTLRVGDIANGDKRVVSPYAETHDRIRDESYQMLEREFKLTPLKTPGCALPQASDDDLDAAWALAQGELLKRPVKLEPK